MVAGTKTDITCMLLGKQSKSEDLRSRSCPYLDTINRFQMSSFYAAVHWAVDCIIIWCSYTARR